MNPPLLWQTVNNKYVLMSNNRRPVSRPIKVILYNSITEIQTHQFYSSFEVAWPFLTESPRQQPKPAE